MTMKRAAALLLSAPAAVIGSAGFAHADEGPKFHAESPDVELLNCFALEVLDIPIVSTAPNQIDCSTNIEVNQYGVQKSVTH